MSNTACIVLTLLVLENLFGVLYNVFVIISSLNSIILYPGITMKATHIYL